MDNNEEHRIYKLLAYGFEKRSFTMPPVPIKKRNYELHFEAYNTLKRFNEYDGVIVLQGIFENFQKKSGAFRTIRNHAYDKDELDKRAKEAKLLIENDGFICFLLNEPFIDRWGEKQTRDTDLSKRFLNRNLFFRYNFRQRIPTINTKRDEFRKFFEVYGAAHSHFTGHNESIQMRTIATTNREIVSMVLFDKLYFIPVLLPENNQDRVAEFFQLLCDAVTSTVTKLVSEIPEWVDCYRFDNENNIIAEKRNYLEKIDDLNKQLSELENYKRILLLTGDQLVDAIKNVFENGFKIEVDDTDELKEDLRLLDDKGDIFALIEVKGTNKGVKRDHINQTDTHRERASLDSNFPAILIINTNMKNARTIEEKDQEIAVEQIRHARSMHILILRTYDLLELLRLFLSDRTSQSEIIKHLKQSIGWLRVQGNKITIT